MLIQCLLIKPYLTSSTTKRRNSLNFTPEPVWNFRQLKVKFSNVLFNQAVATGCIDGWHPLYFECMEILTRIPKLIAQRRRRRIERSQRAHIFWINCCLKIQNAPLKSASPVSRKHRRSCLLFQMQRTILDPLQAVEHTWGLEPHRGSTWVDPSRSEACHS